MINKKNFIVIICLSVLVLATAGIMFYLYQKEALMMRSPLLVQETPSITYLSGEVYFALPDSEDWIEPEAGQKLEQGTLLKTGPDGEIDIRLSEETLLRLDNNSLMILEKSTLKNVNVTLNDGRLYGRFHKLFNEQELNVNTETVTAGIRGTDLVFEAAPDESRIYALSGITEVYNPEYPEDRLLLSFQRKTRIAKGSGPSDPQQMNQEEIQAFQKVLNAIHKQTVLLVTRAIQFKANSAEILESSVPELERLKEQISNSKYTIRIIGHTADIGAAGAQFTLSLERAQAIKDYLVAQGINERRLKVAGFGGSQPVADNDTEEGKARNRRVEFVIIE